MPAPTNPECLLKLLNETQKKAIHAATDPSILVCGTAGRPFQAGSEDFHGADREIEPVEPGGWGRVGEFWSEQRVATKLEEAPERELSAQFPANRLLYSDVYISRGLPMPKPDSLQGSLDLLVLTILLRRQGLHGYAIMSAIQEISGEVLRVEEGSLYPALHRMEEGGWIRAKWVRKDTGRRARIYDLTAAGKKQLGVEESRWHAVTSAVNRVLRMA
jgi:transcriptional regulator